MKKRIFSAVVAIVFAFTLVNFSVNLAQNLSAHYKEIHKNIPHSLPLAFKNSQFKILQMTDFHEWLGQETTKQFLGIQFPAIEHKSTLKPLLADYITSTLVQEQPDLVVLTGDNIFPLSRVSDAFARTSIKTYKAIAQIFENANQPWTMTFGNHDSESVSNKADFLNAVKGYSYFVGGTRDTDYFSQFVGDDDRIGNFSIPIFKESVQDNNTTTDTNITKPNTNNTTTNANNTTTNVTTTTSTTTNPNSNNRNTATSQNEIKFNIFLLDSGSYNSVKDAPYKYITQQQTDWYLSQSAHLKTLNNNTPVPSLIFTHIPLFEHADAYYSNTKQIGVWAGISPSDTHSPIFESAFNSGDVRGIFTGHNHNNSITTFYERDSHKIMMGVTPATQADSYIDTQSELCSRVIILYEDGDFLTYIHTSIANNSVNDGLPHANVRRQETLSFLDN